MIAHLTGTLLHTELEELVLDVGGVGYEIHVPIGTAGRLDENDDGDVGMWIHTSVREDAIQLYGFARRDDRRLFRRLIGVNGIGPRTALATLSELSPSEVVRAVHAEDIKTFTRVSGIGKKTAQRLILELKNKLDDLIGTDAVESVSADAFSEQHDEIRSALQNLGYQNSTIDKVLSKLAADADDDESIDALLRRALQMVG